MNVERFSKFLIFVAFIEKVLDKEVRRHGGKGRFLHDFHFLHTDIDEANEEDQQQTTQGGCGGRRRKVDQENEAKSGGDEEAAEEGAKCAGESARRRQHCRRRYDGCEQRTRRRIPTIRSAVKLRKSTCIEIGQKHFS